MQAQPSRQLRGTHVVHEVAVQLEANRGVGQVDRPRFDDDVKGRSVYSVHGSADALCNAKDGPPVERRSVHQGQPKLVERE